MSNRLRSAMAAAGFAASSGESTPSDTYFENVSLLLHGDGTNGAQNNTFLDSSTNNFTITRNGNTTQGSFSPFPLNGQAYSASVNGGSGYFDGTGDYLTLPSNSALAPEAGDFCIESFIYMNSTMFYGTVFNTHNVTSGFDANSVRIITGNSDNTILFVNGPSTTLLQSSAITTNAWHHVAVIRSGTSLKMYIDGTQAAATTNSSDFSYSSSPAISNTSFTWNGYISNFRFVKGSAVYNISGSTITVPTSPVTAISGTSLLCNFTNAGIFDNAMKNDLETVGNAQVSTSVKKYGTGSMYFDGSGDYLSSRMLSDLVTFGNGDFTIEMWIYFDDVTTLQCVYDQRPSGTQGAYPVFYVYSGVLRFFSNTTDLISTSVSTGQWYHIAVTRSGNTTSLFKDGVSAGTYGVLINYLNGGDGRPGIGGGGFSTSTFFLNGYIDDLRITKGVARYTANFTPPTVAFENK